MGLNHAMRHHQVQGMHTGQDNDPFKARDMRIAQRVGEMLFLHYPGHLWMVMADCRQGYAAINIPVLMGPTARYILHLDKLAGDPGLRAVVKAGGEILERYSIPRSGLEQGLSQFLSARQKHSIIRPNDPFPVY